jgi:ABC-2 type transport system permease protein
MSLLRPGSVTWLLAHEIRMGWREMSTQKGRLITLIALSVLFVILAGVGFPIGLAVRDLDLTPVPAVHLAFDLGLALLFTLMLSQTLAAAAQALYARADLDLLFSSPLPPRTVLTVRFAGIALGASSLYLVLLAGILIPIALMGTPQWLGALGVVASLGLLASAVGLVLTTVLFRLLGARRTRTVAQVLAAVIGASLFLLSQSGQFMGNDNRRFSDMMADLFSGDAQVTLPPLADLPLRAIMGEPLPLISMMAGALLIFVAVNQLLGRRFARDAASALGVESSGRKPGRVTGAFADGAFAATLRKELRLLTRDVALLSQVLLRLLYLLPLAFILLRNASEGHNLLLPGGAAAVSVMAGQLASSLVWITVSAEDAPDLLVASPAPFSTINRAKLWAALIPTALMLAIPLGLLTFVAPWTGLVATAGAAASAASAGMIGLWHQRPGNRADFRRKGQVHWLVSVAILLIGGLIGVATFLAAWMQALAIIPAIFAAVFTLAMRKSDTAILKTLRERA